MQLQNKIFQIFFALLAYGFSFERAAWGQEKGTFTITNNDCSQQIQAHVYSNPSSPPQCQYSGEWFSLPKGSKEIAVLKNSGPDECLYNLEILEQKGAVENLKVGSVVACKMVIIPPHSACKCVKTK